jgi:hypothetical protein
MPSSMTTDEVVLYAVGTRHACESVEVIRNLR